MKSGNFQFQVQAPDAQVRISSHPKFQIPSFRQKFGPNRKKSKNYPNILTDTTK
jgi:hypothetical protein